MCTTDHDVICKLLRSVVAEVLSQKIVYNTYTHIHFLLLVRWCDLVTEKINRYRFGERDLQLI